LEDAKYDDNLIKERLIHPELAMVVNLRRETVTRVFQVLQQQGAILRNGQAMPLHISTLEGMTRES
jgi:CRP/FNR family transcriptional regulator, cyclic AMP receptor protein